LEKGGYILHQFSTHYEMLIWVERILVPRSRWELFLAVNNMLSVLLVLELCWVIFFNYLYAGLGFRNLTTLGI